MCVCVCVCKGIIRISATSSTVPNFSLSLSLSLPLIPPLQSLYTHTVFFPQSPNQIISSKAYQYPLLFPPSFLSLFLPPFLVHLHVIPSDLLILHNLLHNLLPTGYQVNINYLLIVFIFFRAGGQLF